MNHKRLFSLLMTLALTAFLFACAPARQSSAPAGQLSNGKALAFENIVSGDAHLADFTQPRIMIFTKPEDVADIIGALDPDQVEIIRQFDFSSNLLIMAFRPQQPSTGYGIEITGVSLSQDGIRIIATLTDPVPDSGQAEVITFPYTAISLPSQSVPSSSTAWALFDMDGNLLAETTYP